MLAPSPDALVFATSAVPALHAWSTDLAPVATSAAAPVLRTPLMNPLELALADSLNRERIAVGLPPLIIDATLVVIARARSRDMATNAYFSHYQPDGTLAVQPLLDMYQVEFTLAGENIARNNYADDQSVAVAVRDLMASSTHRATILGEEFTKLGVGLSIDATHMKYFTMVFLG